MDWVVVCSAIAINTVMIVVGVRKMSEALMKLTAQVEAISNVVESAIVLINNIASQIRDCPANEDALNALAATLEQQASALAAAVAANTPAEGSDEASDEDDGFEDEDAA